MKTVLVHPLAGVLSAYGMGLAELRVVREATMEVRLDDAAAPSLADRLDALAAAAERGLEGAIDPLWLPSTSCVGRT